MSYLIYDDALARPIGIGAEFDISIIEWIRQQIKVTNDGIIRVRVADLKKTLGPKCEKKDDLTLYGGLRNALKKYGIDAKCRTSIYGTKILMMSKIKYKHDKQ